MTCSAKLKFRQNFFAREILLLHAVSKMVEQDEVQERIASCVRGYHIYKEKWTAAVGEILCCAREVGNVLDRYAVSVLKDGDIVGHLPRKISKVCSLFLRRGDSISCEMLIATSARESSTLYTSWPRGYRTNNSTCQKFG